MENQDDSMYSRVAESVTETVWQTCPTCHRGAAGVSSPTLDDLEAIIQIRDGFNKYRRDFSPEMADRFRRLDSIVGYLHLLIEGTINGS